MKRLPLVLLLFLGSFLLGAKEFTLANYNVQNLFDLERSGQEYVDYIPNTKAQWNSKNYQIKLHNIARAISDMKPEVVALEELESETALKDLQQTLRRLGQNYPYQAISREKKSTVNSAVLSKFPILSQDEILVNPDDGIRSILELKLDIEGKHLYLFVNHWKSKQGPESKRIPYGKALYNRVKKLKAHEEYILIGDFNSNYNEWQSFKKSQKLNNSKGVTAVNHFLHTIHDDRINSLNYVQTASEKAHYNLWMELPDKDRWSYLFRGKNNTLDHIIIPKALIDEQGIDYVKNSFRRFMPHYLVTKRKIFKWKFSKKGGFKHHKGVGYSDHLPIIATFSY